MRGFILSLIQRLQPIRSMKVSASFDRALEDSDINEDPRIIQVVSSKSEVFRNGLLTGKEKTVNNHQTVVPFSSIISRISDDYSVVYSYNEGKSRSMRFGSRIIGTRMAGYFVKDLTTD